MTGSGGEMGVQGPAGRGQVALEYLRGAERLPSRWVCMAPSNAHWHQTPTLSRCDSGMSPRCCVEDLVAHKGHLWELTGH